MDEPEIKRAFRVAYDFVVSHQHPQFTGEYFAGILDEYREIRKSGDRNVLLECLLMGIYEYLGWKAKDGKDIDT